MDEPKIIPMSAVRFGHKPFRVQLADEFGATISLTGAIIWFTIKINKVEADPGEFQIRSDVTASYFTLGPAGAYVDIILTPADNGSLIEGTDYIYDVKVKLASGQERYPFSGPYRVTTPVTLTT